MCVSGGRIPFYVTNESCRKKKKQVVDTGGILSNLYGMVSEKEGQADK